MVLQANPIQSNITKLCIDSSKSRLFTVAPGENFVKVLELNTFKELFSIKLKNSISAFDISQDMNRYAVSFSSGKIAVMSRNFEDEEEGFDLGKDPESRDMELLE